MNSLNQSELCNVGCKAFSGSEQATTTLNIIYTQNSESAIPASAPAQLAARQLKICCSTVHYSKRCMTGHGPIQRHWSRSYMAAWRTCSGPTRLLGRRGFPSIVEEREKTSLSMKWAGNGRVEQVTSYRGKI